MLGPAIILLMTWYFWSIKGALAFKTAEPLLKRNTEELFPIYNMQRPHNFVGAHWRDGENFSYGIHMRERLLSTTTRKSRKKRTTSRVNLVQAETYACTVGNRQIFVLPQSLASGLL